MADACCLPPDDASDTSEVLRFFSAQRPVDLEFVDIRYTAKIWKPRSPFIEKKEILHGVCGEFRSGQLTAIMGPSGAGKSTLLNVLAGYKMTGASGRVLVNGCNRPKWFSLLSCYIQQDDRLRDKISALEAMTIAAHLKLGGRLSAHYRRRRVQELLEMLGLYDHQHTLTGRLSGGQKKRLSVALELLGNPSVIFLDEPTTGLDSSSCSQTVSLMKLLAKQGHTVICTIHQPSALLFEMFDQLYTVANGRCIYQGNVKELVPYLAQKGLHCPPYHNPADFMIDISVGEYGANIDDLATSAVQQKTVKIKDKVLPAKATYESVKEKCPDDNYHASLLYQMYLLYKRNILSFRRSYNTLLARLMSHISIGLIFGYLYYNCGNNAQAVYANFVYVYGTILLLSFTGQMAVTLSFPLEMYVLKREYFNRWYSLGPYYLSLLFIEIPYQLVCGMLYLVISYFLTGQPLEVDVYVPFFALVLLSSLAGQATGMFIGTTTPIKIAVFVGPIYLCVISMFGFNIFYKHIPYFLRWLFHSSFFRAAFQGCMYTVYGHRTALPCPESEIYCHFKVPNKFLDEVNIIDVNVYGNMSMVAGVFILMHIFSIFSIWYRVAKR